MTGIPRNPPPPTTSTPPDVSGPPPGPNPPGVGGAGGGGGPGGVVTRGPDDLMEPSWGGGPGGGVSGGPGAAGGGAPVGAPTPDAPAAAFPSPAERQTFQRQLDAARAATPPDAARLALLDRIGHLTPPQSSQALAVLDRAGGDAATVRTLNAALDAHSPGPALAALNRAVQATPPQTAIVERALRSDNPAAATAAYSQIARENPGLDAATVQILVDAVGNGRRGPLTEGIMSAAQAGRAARALANMPEPQKTELATLLAAAPSDTHRGLILKALAARTAMIPGQAADAMLTLTTFAGAIHGLDAGEAVRRSTMAETPVSSRPPSDVGVFAQQFESSCGPTTVSIAKGEADPVAALALHDPAAARDLQMRLMSEHGGRTTLRPEVHLGVTLSADHLSFWQKFLDVLLEIITLSLADTKTFNWDPKADVDVLRAYTGLNAPAAGQARPTREQALAAATRLYNVLDDSARNTLGLHSPEDIVRLSEQAPSRLDVSEFQRQADADIARRQARTALPGALFAGTVSDSMRDEVLAYAGRNDATLTNPGAVYSALRPEIRTRYEGAVDAGAVATLRAGNPGMTEAAARAQLGQAAFLEDLLGMIGTGRPSNDGRTYLAGAMFDRAGSRLSRADFTAGVLRNSGDAGTTLGAYLSELTAETGASYTTTGVTTADAAGRLSTVMSDADLANYQRIITEEGLDIPIRIATPGNEYGHFMLVTDARELPGPSGRPERHFLVQDPWTGRAAWATDAEMRDGSFLRRLTPSDNRIITHVYVPRRTD